VWIDHDLCTGDHLCLDHCPEVFVALEDGIAYVRDADTIFHDPEYDGGMAAVPARFDQKVVNAAWDCPGECIFLEPDEGDL